MVRDRVSMGCLNTGVLTIKFKLRGIPIVFCRPIAIRGKTRKLSLPMMKLRTPPA